MGITWQLPTSSFLRDTLQNPHYGGAYAWGRRQMERVVENGKVRKRQTGVLAREKWKVLLPDHHEGYIDWDAYEENQRLMRQTA